MTHTDRTLDRARLTRHPHPHVLADHARDVAKALRQDGPRALDVAPLLAARGWPPGTLGDGPRSADETTSVERAADTPGPFTDLDANLAKALRLYWQTGLKIQELVAKAVEHADDVDPLPAGSGDCEACGVVIQTDAHKRPGWRIRAGLCPTDYRAWRRAVRVEPNLERGEWLRRRRVELRPPEPDGAGIEERLNPGHTRKAS